MHLIEWTIAPLRTRKLCKHCKTEPLELEIERDSGMCVECAFRAFIFQNPSYGVTHGR